MFVNNQRFGYEIIFMWNCTPFSQTEGFCFRWHPVLQALALEMMQLPPADGELHTLHAVPACFEGFKPLSICFTKVRARFHCKQKFCDLKLVTLH